MVKAGQNKRYNSHTADLKSRLQRRASLNTFGTQWLPLFPPFGSLWTTILTLAGGATNWYLWASKDPLRVGLVGHAGALRAIQACYLGTAART
jgi:hypothetical protein